MREPGFPCGESQTDQSYTEILEDFENAPMRMPVVSASREDASSSGTVELRSDLQLLEQRPRRPANPPCNQIACSNQKLCGIARLKLMGVAEECTPLGRQEIGNSNRGVLAQGAVQAASLDLPEIP